MMRLHGNRRWLSLPVCMLVMALRLPLSLLIRYVCPDVTASAVSYDLAVMAQEAVLWLLPALFLMPWRTRRSGDRLPRSAVAAGALGGGALVQLSLSALRLLLPVRRVFCRRLGWFAGTLLRFAKRCLSVPAKACKSRKTAGQRQKNRTESPKKQLQTTPELLYNSNV